MVLSEGQPILDFKYTLARENRRFRNELRDLKKRIENLEEAKKDI